MSVQPYVSGRVDFSFEVTDAAKQKEYEIAVRLWGYGNDIRQIVRRDAYKSYTSIQIENPRLWFPNGYGEQALYNYCVELIVDGKVADSRE